MIDLQYQRGRIITLLDEGLRQSGVRVKFSILMFPECARQQETLT